MCMARLRITPGQESVLLGTIATHVARRTPSLVLAHLHRHVVLTHTQVVETKPGATDDPVAAMKKPTDISTCIKPHTQ